MSDISIDRIMSTLSNAHQGQNPKGILGFLTPKDIRNLSQSNKILHKDIVDSQVLLLKCNAWTDKIQAEYDARYRCWNQRISRQSCSRCGCRAHVDPFGDRVCFCNTCPDGCNVNYYDRIFCYGSSCQFYRYVSNINSKSKMEEDCYTIRNITMWARKYYGYKN